MSRVRTIFFCGEQSPYGRAHLEPVLDAFDVVAVVTPAPARCEAFRSALSGAAPARRASLLARIRRWAGGVRGKSRNPAPVHVARVLRWRGLRAHVVYDVNDADTLRWTAGLAPELLLSAAYPQIFGAALLGVARRGAVNFHPSLLPRFRGAHPHFWAIASGAASSGVTAHFMTERLDDGDVVAQRGFPIDGLTYTGLYQRIIAETPQLVREVADFFAHPGRAARPQDESQATFFRNDRDIHRRIFWRLQTAEQIRNLCRTERAFCFHHGRPITLLDVSTAPHNRNLTNGVAVEGGTVVDVAADGLVIRASDGCVAVRQVSFNGRKFPSDRWARRCRVRIGEILQ